MIIHKVAEVAVGIVANRTEPKVPPGSRNQQINRAEYPFFTSEYHNFGFIQDSFHVGITSGHGPLLTHFFHLPNAKLITRLKRLVVPEMNLYHLLALNAIVLSIL